MRLSVIEINPDTFGLSVHAKACTRSTTSLSQYSSQPFKATLRRIGERGETLDSQSPKRDTQSLSVYFIESIVRVVRVSISDTGACAMKSVTTVAVFSSLFSGVN